MVHSTNSIHDNSVDDDNVDNGELFLIILSVTIVTAADETPNEEDTSRVEQKPYNVSLKASARTIGGGVRKVAKGRGKKTTSV